MIDYINYNQKIVPHPSFKGKTNVNTTLETKFSFNYEVAPKDVEEVKKRLNWQTRGGSLREYLEGKENLSYVGVEDIPNKNIHFRRLKDDVKFNLKENLKKLRLDISLSCTKDILRKDMFDLEALNTFIFTGKTPE